jgi:ATP synthase F1 complex assembly factor 1
MLRLSSRLGRSTLLSHRVGRAVLTERVARLDSARCLSSSLVVPGTPRALADVAKLELLEGEEPVRIGAIWDAFHEEREGVAGAALGPEEHASLAERGAESPMFIFPLRREGGHFMLFSQYTPVHNMFVLTSLEDYRRSPETAQPWASLHLFDELLTTKGVGLLRAEVASDRLTSEEAAHLLLLIRRYYGTSNYDRVWAFNHFNQRFDFDAYLASCP